MRFFTHTAFAALFLAAGCGNPDLDALEREQAALRAQVDSLKVSVGTLRSEMVDAGLVSPKQGKGRASEDQEEGGEGKSGKAKRRGKKDDEDEGPGLGHTDPGRELSSALSVGAARTGSAPALPALTDMERVESACGFKFVLRDLQPLSDYPLNSAGFGKAGPVLMLEDGKPMTAHALPEAFEESCGGAFRHAGYAFFFSPSDSAEGAASHTYTLGLDPEVPLRRGDDDAPVYWVYPGTTLTFTVGSWDLAWGDLHVAVGGRVALPGEASATVTLPGREAEVAAERPSGFAIRHDVETPPSGPWTITIASPEDGPWLVLGVVTAGNADNAVVIANVTGDEA